MLRCDESSAAETVGRGGPTGRAISGEETEAVRDALAGEKFREDVRSLVWVGIPITEALGIKEPKGAGKARLKGIIKVLRANGIVIEKKEWPSRNNREQVYLVLAPTPSGANLQPQS